MKKKLLAIMAVAATLSAVTLVGCNNNKHKHSYEWKSEGGVHWQECECGDKTAEEAHVDTKNNETGADGKDEKCDVCGADLHVHVYEWKSTALKHWQECVCGDKSGSEADHVDAKINETGADGKDEKCDVCGRGFYAVTFNMGGHGTVATQYIGKDGHVTQPDTPADDDAYKFKGWYKDAQHQTAFDFTTETVTSATVVFAWFEEDTTPGASKKHAYALELDNTNPQKAKKNEVVYYSFKASKSGRYTISLPAGTNSANATFTTSATGATVYGKDCDAEEITVDVYEKQTVYVLYTYSGETGDDVVVSPIVTEVTNEPMPADYFLKGEYYNGTSVIEITDRTDADHQTLTLNGVPYTFRYIGGNFDRIYFTDSSSQSLGAVTYYLRYENGTYKFSSSQNSTASTYEYTEPQDPVALSKILGYYEPVSTVGGGSSSGEGE